MPLGPYQYCEALRTASSFGWYVFPLEDTFLRWDGHDVFVYQDDEWTELISEPLVGQDYEIWQRYAPESVEPPPVITSLFVPGIIQIWSGLLVTTGPDWSLRVGPLANVTKSHAYFTYEGIVETDEFKPMPLFINIRLIETNRDIFFDKAKPLFQVQPLPRQAYRGDRQPDVTAIENMTSTEWAGIDRTIRDPGERAPGAYAAAVRRRAKREELT
jgi:hypothetical protein